MVHDVYVATYALAWNVHTYSPSRLFAPVSSYAGQL